MNFSLPIYGCISGQLLLIAVSTCATRSANWCFGAILSSFFAIFFDFFCWSKSDLTAIVVDRICFALFLLGFDFVVFGFVGFFMREMGFVGLLAIEGEVCGLSEIGVDGN